MTIVLEPGDSWQGIREGTIIQVEFKMSSLDVTYRFFNDRFDA